MCATENLRFVMDETSMPYEQDENPFPKTNSDDEFEKMIITKYHLITKEMELKMSKEKIGFQALVKVIGEQFFKEHENNAVFSYGEEDQGLFCFLGINLHPSNELNGLSASIDDWDIYASCYVTETQVIMGKCRLP